MDESPLLPDPAEEIAAADVLALRQHMFGDGVVRRDEAEVIFWLDGNCAEKDPSWAEFYVDALTDHFVWQAEPRGYVCDENARFLIDHIVHNGRVDSASELELLVNVIHWSQSCPEMLAVFALGAVCESVLTPDKAAYGKGRRAGVIDAVDTELVRKIIYAGAGGGGFTVTHTEAELIFDLNDATVEAENAPAWRDLFVKAVANHLMFPRGAPEVPDAKEHARRETWLKERKGVGNLLTRVVRQATTVNFAKTWREADPFGTREAATAAKREDARVREAFGREAIDKAEAAWLIERVERDKKFHANEAALLAFIRDNATEIHPSLEPLLAKV